MILKYFQNSESPPTQQRTVAAPVFVLGFPRSGTEAMANGLGAGKLHYVPSGKNSSEGHILYLFKEALSRIKNQQVNANCLVRDETARQALLTGLADALNASFLQGNSWPYARWIDKTPDISMVRTAPFIFDLFPDAKIIFMHRNAQDAVRSNIAKFSDILPGDGIEKVKNVAIRWEALHREWRGLRAQMDKDSYLEVFQPELRDHPERVAARVAEHLSLPHDTLTLLTDFWAKNRQVNRPTAGRAAQVYDAVHLTGDAEREVAKICKAESRFWPEHRR